MNPRRRGPESLPSSYVRRDLCIEPLGNADVDAAVDLLDAAYGPSRGRGEALRRYLRFQPDGWVMVRRDGEMVGMVGTIDYGAFAYLGMLAVRPSAQRGGLGKRLMEERIARLQSRGCPAIFLDATPAGAHMYERLGFVDDGRTLRFKREDLSHSAAESTLEVSRLREKDLPELVRFDSSIFGAERGRVLAAFLADHPDRAFATRTPDGRLTGFLISQAQNVGPWVSKDAECADALLRAALALAYDDAPRVIAPEANSWLPSLLERSGFRFRESLRRMRLGAPTRGSARSRLCGQASFVIG